MLNFIDQDRPKHQSLSALGGPPPMQQGTANAAATRTKSTQITNLIAILFDFTANQS